MAPPIRRRSKPEEPNLEHSDDNVLDEVVDAENKDNIEEQKLLQNDEQ